MLRTLEWVEGRQLRLDDGVTLEYRVWRPMVIDLRTGSTWPIPATAFPMPPGPFDPDPREELRVAGLALFDAVAEALRLHAVLRWMNRLALRIERWRARWRRQA